MARLLRRRDRAGEALGGDIAVGQTLPTFGESGGVPRIGIQVKPDQPPIQQVVLELLDQLALTADRV